MRIPVVEILGFILGVIIVGTTGIYIGELMMTPNIPSNIDQSQLVLQPNTIQTCCLDLTALKVVIILTFSIVIFKTCRRFNLIPD